jgi:hypothetical protein
MKKCIASILIFAALTMFAQNIFGQDAKSYTKAANHLVELLNAGDYSGVESLFNKEMGKALPLDKAAAFFTGLTARSGKIQKLDEPKRSAGWTVFPAHFERGLMDLSLVLDREEKIAGITFKPRGASSQAAPEKQQEEEPYTKVANHLIELINKGDYLGVENVFNKEMSKALPLKEATEFFAGLTGQVGKIQKLDEPKHNAEGTVFSAQCERGKLDMLLVLDDKNKIAGLNFAPHAESSGAAPKK